MTEGAGWPAAGPPAVLSAPLSPLAALRRHWLVGGLLIALAVIGGVLAGDRRPVTYTAQARLAVGGQDLRNFQIPGFALAAQEVASNYARYVGLPQSQQDFRRTLGSRSSEVSQVLGSPIATSNIILIEVVATSPDVAVSAADTVADTLMAEANASNTPQTAAYLAQYVSVTRKLYSLQAALTAAKRTLGILVKVGPDAPGVVAHEVVVQNIQTEIAVVSIQLQTLSSQYSSAVTGATSYSQLVSAQRAVVTVISRRRTQEKYGVAGGVFGVVLALAVSMLVENARRRRAERRRRKTARLAARADPRRSAEVAEPAAAPGP